MIAVIKKYYEKYKEAVSYLFWGGCTTIVNWGSYSLYVSFIHENVAAANAVSWILATVFAFVTNKVFVFHSRSWRPADVAREAGLFVSARLITGTFEIILVPLLVRIGFTYAIGGIKGSAAKITVSILVVILNYFISKLVIFKKDKSEDDL